MPFTTSHDVPDRDVGRLTTTEGLPPAERDVRHVLELAEAIRPMPASVGRLAAVVSDEFGQLSDVAAVVREDPMLVTNLLTEANSAASSPLSKITTVEAAVTRLGLARVMAVASLAVFGPDARKALDAYRMPAGALIEHAVRSSYVAEAAYGMLSGELDASVVTAALLHDLGMLALDMVLDRDQVEEAMAEGVVITTVERELVKVDHAELGALMLETWALPACLITAVRHHHEPFSVSDPATHVVAVADLLTHERYPTGAVDGDSRGDVLASLLDRLWLDRAELVRRSDRMMERAGLPIQS